jgi:methionine-rich copper-binding protein CopC
MSKVIRLLVVLAFTVVFAPAVWAHAFPQRALPKADATLHKPPKRVKIWFDGQIEPHFSTLIVKNSAGKQVSVGKGKVSSTDKTLLQAALAKTLPPGQYQVDWSVVARDGHHTAGDFSFTVK